MKVAIVHYWFTTWRGGEKVVNSILDLYPDADIYTLFLEDDIKDKYFPNNKVYTSLLNKVSFFRKNYQKIFPLYPLAVKSLKLREKYDLIISSESGPVKGIKKHKDTKHLCYIHTPMRYCWGFMKDYLNAVSKLQRPLVKFFFNILRVWDSTTVKNVDKFVSNSKNVKKRVKKFYNRDAVVVYPPIDLSLFNKKVKSKGNEGEFYLSFGAITPYKRIDLLVDLFNNREEKLVIIGGGSEKEKLEAKSNPNISFLGKLTDEELEYYFINAKALIFPGEEDFGMIPLEVMAHGLPVIAYNKGGALETVIENDKIETSTGLFFEEQTVESLRKVVERFNDIELKFDPNYIKEHARKFGDDIFKKKIKTEIDELINR